MRGQRILITGGAGFIGSHLAERLLAAGHQVRVVDNLCAQVHGPACERPTYLDPDVELVEADVRDETAMARALRGVEAVYHLAARVGVGQSMYRIADYTSVNDLGTAVLLEQLSHRPVRRLIVASSMSLYGEGLYRDEAGQPHEHVHRSPDQLQQGQWEPRDEAGRPLLAHPTPEDKPPALASVYALNKHVQERLVLTVGQAYGMEAAALRLFNCYGPRQALSNPYTGVLAIFASRLLNDRPPILFEDGQQQRDFVSVHDVARAFQAALDAPDVSGQVINIGSGQPRTVREAAEQLIRVMDKPAGGTHVSGRYRAGDIRHCVADIRRARRLLGYEPTVSFGEGLAELAGWLEDQAGLAHDHTEAATAELTTRGLTA